METPREVQNPEDNTQWSCVPALATAEAAGKIPVVCTPSGGARSVRLELAADWREGLADAELLAAIAAGGE